MVIMRKQRGSRANRTGLTRSGQRALSGLLREPLPDDRGERYVEEARRSWLKAAWSDQRLPANKKNAERRYAVYEQAAEHHLKRDHGATITKKTERYSGIAFTEVFVDGEKTYSLTKLHDMLHKED